MVDHHQSALCKMQEYRVSMGPGLRLYAPCMDVTLLG